MTSPASTARWQFWIDRGVTYSVDDCRTPLGTLYRENKQ
jgi:hypothetical protein